ncbi:MAG: hypothetical protein K0S27_1088 [Gammaproteobacteria bacterium]|nr:hypothetical protein [Gammaproteobacteria bacterium]
MRARVSKKLKEPIQAHHTAEEKKQVLTKSILRLAEHLQLSRQELAIILGSSQSSLSRLFAKTIFIDPASKEGELAILLLRIYRSLHALLGGNLIQCQLWLRSENKHLHEKPITLIQSIQGLVLVVQYLDAMRGKNG